MMQHINTHTASPRERAEREIEFLQALLVPQSLREELRVIYGEQLAGWQTVYSDIQKQFHHANQSK
jgi:hypothetical protein